MEDNVWYLVYAAGHPITHLRNDLLGDGQTLCGVRLASLAVHAPLWRLEALTADSNRYGPRATVQTAVETRVSCKRCRRSWAKLMESTGNVL